MVSKIMLQHLQIQSKGSELDSLRTRNEALEAQIREMQEKYRKELEDLQVCVHLNAVVTQNSLPQQIYMDIIYIYIYIIHIADLFRISCMQTQLLL